MILVLWLPWCIFLDLARGSIVASYLDQVCRIERCWELQARRRSGLVAQTPSCPVEKPLVVALWVMKRRFAKDVVLLTTLYTSK